jgi:hypothetical protein
LCITHQEYFERVFLKWNSPPLEQRAIVCVTYLSFETFRGDSTISNEAEESDEKSQCDEESKRDDKVENLNKLWKRLTKSLKRREKRLTKESAPLLLSFTGAAMYDWSKSPLLT